MIITQLGGLFSSKNVNLSQKSWETAGELAREILDPPVLIKQAFNPQ
ncbi:hypothetical protein [Microcystis sp. BLCC-F210]